MENTKLILRFIWYISILAFNLTAVINAINLEGYWCLFAAIPMVFVAYYSTLINKLIR